MAELGIEDFAPAELGGEIVPVTRRTSTIAPGGDHETRPSRWAAWGVPGEAIRLIEHPDELRDTLAMVGARELLVEGRCGRVWGLLAGGLGAGKSVAAGWWLTHVRSGGGLGRMYVASQTVAALPLGTVWAEERIERLVGAAALVLDDVGVRDGAEGKLHPTLLRVLTERYDKRRPTLCTGNLLPETDWPAYLADERLLDRWREIGAWRDTGATRSMRGRLQP
jgi:hypothetical protein